MLAVMSLMISAVSGLSFTIFSMRSMEWSTVVWSRPSNSRPISFRERLVFPVEAERLYRYFVEVCRKSVPEVQTGEFGADMKVSLVNDGPFTIILE